MGFVDRFHPAALACGPRQSPSPPQHLDLAREVKALAARKLFVGATRAMMKLVLVLSEPAAKAISRCLDIE